MLGVGRDDTEADAIYLAEKIAGLRVFEDDQGKMNRSVLDVGGSVLAVSQFTLYGDVRRGKRPSFDAAAPPEKARQLYEFFVEQIRAAGLRCETGRFQEMMQVEFLKNAALSIEDTKPHDTRIRCQRRKFDCKSRLFILDLFGENGETGGSDRSHAATSFEL